MWLPTTLFSFITSSVIYVLLYNKTVRSFRFFRLRVFAFTQASVLPTGLRCTLTELRCPSGLCYTESHDDILPLSHDSSSVEQYLCIFYILSKIKDTSKAVEVYYICLRCRTMPDCLTIPHLIYVLMDS